MRKAESLSSKIKKTAMTSPIATSVRVFEALAIIRNKRDILRKKLNYYNFQMTQSSAQKAQKFHQKFDRISNHFINVAGYAENSQKINNVPIMQ